MYSIWIHWNKAINQQEKKTTENVKVMGIKQHTLGWWMGYLRNVEENLQVPIVK